MQELYSEKDFEKVDGLLKKRYLVLVIVLTVILAVFVWSFVVRIEWLSMVTFFLIFAVALFVIELFCLPLHRYRALIRSALSGRTHTDSYEFGRMEEETSVVDGVPCRSMVFLGAPDKHGTREQCFYWDSELPLPAFKPGDRVTLKYTGRNIIGYELG